MSGSNVEREFINLLSDEYGYSCLRAPGSGARTKRPRPDAIALKSEGMATVGFAVEIKKRPDGTVTFTQAEIDALNEWATIAGLKPYVVVKPDLRSFDHWLVMHISNLHQTDMGQSIRKQDHDDCKSISEVF